MAEITGQVRNKRAVPFNGKQGPITLHSFQIEGDSRFFRAGTKTIPADDGDQIRFTAEEKAGNFNVDVSTISKVESAGKVVGRVAASSSAKDTYWADKDAYQKNVVEPRINFSASQRDAVALVTAALEFDCLSFGSTAKGKKLDMLLDYVDQVTDRFVAQRQATGVQDG
jgi:hypothetical protein